MIKFNIRGENIEVTDSIRSYVEEKISKLEKYFTENKKYKDYHICNYYRRNDMELQSSSARIDLLDQISGNMVRISFYDFKFVFFDTFLVRNNLYKFRYSIYAAQ